MYIKLFLIFVAPLLLAPKAYGQNETVTTTTESSNNATSNETTTTTTVAPSTNETDVTVIPYDDETTFDEWNSWNTNGAQVKGNLSILNADGAFGYSTTPSTDNMIFACSLGKFTCTLTKEYPVLINPNISLTHYVKMNSEQTLTFSGDLSSSQGDENFISITDTSAALAYSNWGTDTFVPKTNGTNFTVTFTWTSDDTSDDIYWVIDQINVRGYEVVSGDLPDVTLPPDTEETTTTAMPETNVTTTTEAPTTTIETTTVTTTTTTEDPLGGIAALASSMWTAFYVLLALFIACLLVIIIMWALTKFKGTSEPTVAPYNPSAVSGPRSGSYDVDNARINHAYETDSV